MLIIAHINRMALDTALPMDGLILVSDGAPGEGATTSTVLGKPVTIRGTSWRCLLGGVELSG